jgi:hypothetical protein
VRDLKELNYLYQQLSGCATAWAMEYLTPDLDTPPESHVEFLITRLDGFCVQMDWPKLRPLLPPTVRNSFGQVLGELLIYLTIHERLFEKPFW